MARTLEPYRDRFLPDQFQRWLETVRLRIGTIPCYTYTAGSPEGVINGQKGDWYFDNVANDYYFKSSDTGNTGWISLAALGGAPGGVDTNIQFNDAGAFGGFGSWDGTSFELDTGEKISINSQVADNVSLVAGTGSVHIGNDIGIHIAFDRNHIQQKQTGTTVGTLHINNLGGSVLFGNATAVTNFGVNASGSITLLGADVSFTNAFYDESLARFEVGGGTISTPGLSVNSTAGGEPFLRFSRAGTPVAFIDFNNSNTSLDIDSDNTIRFLPFNTTSLELFAEGPSLIGGIRFAERADHAFTPAAAFGELWLDNLAPQRLKFTDDLGDDYVLGVVVQEEHTNFPDVATGTGIIDVANSIPQITEGTEHMTRTITPTSSTNLLRIDVVAHVSSNSGSNPYIAVPLFQDAVADALATGYDRVDSTTANVPANVAYTFWMVAGTTSLITFRVRAGTNVSSTVTFNGANGSRLYGLTQASSITVTEYLA